ncbi:MAG: BON domain-containing protein [Castellaniella sp.]
MKITRALMIAAFSAASAVMLAGCSVANNQETMGEYIDGSAVTAQVKAKLAEDPITSATAINVKTMDGGTVQLSGFVKNQNEKDRAGTIASRVKGVTSVHNNLIVKL